MNEMTIKEIGEKLAVAGRLLIKPLCVYGSKRPPDDGVPSTSISSCVSRAIFSMASRREPFPLFIGKANLSRCCGGGAAWLGFTRFAPHIKYFISKGTKEFRDGAAEYLRATPEIAEDNMRRIGRITPPGDTIVVRSCSDLDGSDPGVRAILCFAEPEQIRNLCSLVYFRADDPFCSVIVPLGPSCASFVTFASGMAENAPKDSVILGPLDPTGNSWLPQSMMSIAIPLKIAKRMAHDVDSSFIMKRPDVAYPKRRSRP